MYCIFGFCVQITNLPISLGCTSFVIMDLSATITVPLIISTMGPKEYLYINN